MAKGNILKGKQHEDNCSIDSLCNSNMSYPTWEDIKMLLDVQFNNPESFGEKPLTKVNVPIYSTINEDIIKEHKENTPYGIDIPVLLEPGTKTETEYTKPLIVIVGESALRTKEDLEYFKDGAAKNVILGTPYAIHLQECPPKCGVYRKIFDAILKEEYPIYITDIIKIWWKRKKGYLLIPNALDIEVFNKELEKLKSYYGKCIFVTWGNKAKRGLQKVLGNVPNENILSLPHPSVMNWDAWKLRIFEKAIYGKGIKYATDLYPNKESATSEDIVATEAVKEILEHMEVCSESETVL
jgi:hypothetical protein